MSHTAPTCSLRGGCLSRGSRVAAGWCPGFAATGAPASGRGGADEELLHPGGGDHELPVVVDGEERDFLPVDVGSLGVAVGQSPQGGVDRPDRDARALRAWVPDVARALVQCLVVRVLDQGSR
jgi:hypothetical protein